MKHFITCPACGHDFMPQLNGHVECPECRLHGPNEAARLHGYEQKTELTPTSHELFMDFAKDAGNWSGTPLVDGNVAMDSQLRGNLSDLVKKGFITVFKNEGNSWVDFTEAGKAYAAEHGVDLSCF